MYLREIGQVHLLNADQETWLSARLLALRRARSVRERLTALPKNNRALPAATQFYLELYGDLLSDWKHLREDARRLGQAVLDPGRMLAEARRLRSSWQDNDPSYLRNWLERGPWGRDQAWNRVAQDAFDALVVLYLLPDGVGRKLEASLRRRKTLPAKSTLQGWLLARRPPPRSPSGNSSMPS